MEVTKRNTEERKKKSKTTVCLCEHARDSPSHGEIATDINQSREKKEREKKREKGREENRVRMAIVKPRVGEEKKKNVGWQR